MARPSPADRNSDARGRAGHGRHHSSSRPRKGCQPRQVPRRIRRPAARRRERGPARPDRRLDAFTDGVERQIDVAEVNGRVFLNNVSLGIYGQAVRRSAYRDAKVRTLLATAEEVLGSSGEAPALRLVDDAGREHRDPAVVLVSNNPYALDNSLAPGTRPAADTGRLGIVVLGVPGDTSLRSGRAWTAPRLEVSAPAAAHAGVGGEAVDLSPPLRFAIRPAELRARISSRHPGASPSARLHLPPAPPSDSQDQLSDQVCDVLSVLNSYSRNG